MHRRAGVLIVLSVLWVVVLVIVVCFAFLIVGLSGMCGGSSYDVGVVPDTVPHWVRGDTLVTSEKPSLCVL